MAIERLTRIDRTIPGVYRADSYFATEVTVPAPTTAPTVSTPTVVLGTFGVQPGNAAFTAGNIYDVAITYNGKTGESLIGTAFATFTAATGQGLAVHPNAPDTTLAASANIYLRNTSGDNTWRRASDASGAIENNNCGFGDGDSAVGGMVVKYNAAGAAPPGASTATKPDGSTALGETPNQAPTLTKICALLSTDGTLFYAISWLCEDGTETALSPFSSGVTAPSSTIGAWMALYVNQTPPLGAVAIRVYAGTSASAGAMKFQLEAPVCFPRIPIHSFNASGAAHSTGTAQSEVPSVMLANKARMDAGGGGTVIVSGVIQTKVPLIFSNPTGDKFAGRITGEGSNNASYNSADSKTKIEYIGTKTGVPLVVTIDSTLKIENIDFADPNSRVKYGMVISDFESGQGHNNTFNNVTIRAMETGARGIVSTTNSANSTGHTSDNCIFDQCTVFTDTWAVDLAGNQTVEYDFRHLACHVLNAGNTANSGVARIAAQNVRFSEHLSAAECGHYFIYQTNEYLDTWSATGSRVHIESLYSDASDNRKAIYTSPLDVNGSLIRVESLYNVNQTGTQVYGVLIDNPARVEIEATYRMGSDIYNYSNSIQGQLLDGLWPNIYARSPWKTRGTSTATYEKSLIELMCGALGFRSEGDEVSRINTDAGGNLILQTASGNLIRFYVGGTLAAQSSSADFSFTIPLDTPGRILITTNNVFYRGRTTFATEMVLIGANSNDKVGLDPNGVGVEAGGQLKATGKLLSTAGLGAGNSASATTLGSVVKKLEVFDAAGASLGFLAIYDAVT